MSYVLTNKTAQTPLGFGALGFALEPGKSATVTAEQFATIEAHPVIAGWIGEGKLSVSQDAGGIDPMAEYEAEEAEAKRVEDAAKLATTAAPKVEPPKVPTPTPGKSR